MEKQLIFDGFIYLKSKSAKGKVYWDCKRLRTKECRARAVTTEPDLRGDIFIKDIKKLILTIIEKCILRKKKKIQNELFGKFYIREF